MDGLDRILNKIWIDLDWGIYRDFPFIKIPQGFDYELFERDDVTDQLNLALIEEISPRSRDIDE